MTLKHTMIVSVFALVAGLAVGALVVDYFRQPSSIVVQSDKIDAARQQADVKEITVVKEAVTKRRQAAKRVDAEVQREVTTSDLADYLDAHAAVGGDPMGGSADRSARDQGDGRSVLGNRARDHPDSVAPGAP